MEQRRPAIKPKTFRVKVLKQFKAPDGNAVTMVYPGDVVELDTYTASVLIGADRAEETTDALHIDRDGAKKAMAAAAERVVAMDPMALLAKTLLAMHKTLEQLAGGGLFTKKG
jgi:hypothetical protein